MENSIITITPKVNQENEFREIASDFGIPLELVREAISNSYDYGATIIVITFNVEEDGSFIIELKDNGVGMSFERLKENFWDLGNSSSKDFKEKIGEKGHGTKIYLRAKKVEVWTNNGESSFYSWCDNPLADLKKGKLHQPHIKEIDKDVETGTTIRLTDYSRDFRTYTQERIKDYIYWFTKHGSIELEFGITKLENCKIFLKGLDKEEPELLTFGHRFADINDDIDFLFEKYDADAADYFVKKYLYKDQHLEKFPHIAYDVVIYVEGDSAKRKYNPMLGEKRSKRGKYKVSDRYGIYLCKDCMPVQNVNDWITSFGTGSNSVVLLHGFINCQSFKLTANRGSIANTDVEVIEAMKEEIQSIIQDINIDLYKKNCLDTLKQWQNESKTLELEKAEYENRKKRAMCKRSFNIANRVLYYPSNEQETYTIFNALYTLNPKLFTFEPLDYNTTKGIDIFARKHSDQPLKDCEFFYVELKYKMKKDGFNHSFENINTIICWDFNQDLKDGSKINSVIDTEAGYYLKIVNDENKGKDYFIDNDRKNTKIKIIKLKDIIEKLEKGIIVIDSK